MRMGYSRHKIMLILGRPTLMLTACGMPTSELSPEPPTIEPLEEELPEVIQPVAFWNSDTELRTWLLDGFGDECNSIVVELCPSVAINFNSGDDIVSVSGDCPRHSTTSMADDQSNLKINRPMSSTEIAYQTGMEQETFFLAELETPQSYQVSLNPLVVNTTRGSLPLHADCISLESPKWDLTKTGSVDNSRSPLEGRGCTTKFERQFGMPTGVKSGGTGCNVHTATYFVSPGEIKVKIPQIDRNRLLQMSPIQV